MMRAIILMLVLCVVCGGAVVDEVVPFAAEAFALKDVRLLEGPFKHAQDLQSEWLLALEPDRLLAWFRKEAGLEPKAPVYGGWENQGVAGHCLGHYLSGCSLMFQSTGDTRFLDRVNYIVSELALCQAANGNGYVAAIPGGKDVFRKVARGDIRSAGFDLNGSWVPLYTLHKLFAGLVDAYRLCDNDQALAVNQKLAQWLERTLENLTHDQMQKILACEHGGMNEALADLYADTGERRYLILSRRFHHETVLDPLVQRKDQLSGLHANTQVPKLIGLARRYELTGDVQDRTGAEFFWDRVANHHSYCTGGHCLNEHFGPPDTLNDRLGVNTTETCNVYNMLKLTRHLFQWDAKARTADFYERALYNQILSSHHPEDGRVVYNLTLEMGGFKRYQTKFDSFTCCVGSGMENHAKYGSDIYFHKDDAVFVNLFIASKLNWQEKGLMLIQETAFPDTAGTTLAVICDQPVDMALCIRHPYWIKQGFGVTVNGESVPVTSTPSSYAVIKRTWKDGDQVAVSLPMSLHTHPMPDNPDRVALMYGPLVLAGDLGPEYNPTADRPNFVPVFVPGDRELNDWIKPVAGQACTFKTQDAGRPHDVTLKPFFRVHGRRYSVYWDLFTSEKWQARQDEYKAELARKKALEARTLDFFQPGEMQPERDHDLKGERTGAGEAMGRKWRHATGGGWFSFTMAVQPDEPAQLVCTYWGSDGGGRVFDILIDEEKLATQALENDRPNHFFDKVYTLPKRLTRGKTKVTVKFQAHPGNTAGGVFGVRMVKAD
jgi:DUF1680 family protein